MRRITIATITSVACCCTATGGAQEATPRPQFVESSARLGLQGAGDGEVKAFRVALSDLDGDGYPEAVFHERRAGRAGGRLRLFRNGPTPDGSGARRFTEIRDARGLRTGAAAGVDHGESESVFAVFADLDNDGRIDCVRAAYNNPTTHARQPDTGERSTVLLGTDGGAFRVVPPDPADGLASAGAVTTCAAVLVDVDLDGNLDCFTGNWYAHYGQSLHAHPNRLFLGDGLGGFRDVTKASGLWTTPDLAHTRSARPTYGVSHGDLDGDGWPDLFVATYGRQWNRIWRNNGDGTFTDWAPALGVDGDADRTGRYPDWARAASPKVAQRTNERQFRGNGNTFALLPADLNNDGLLDLVSTEITHAWAGQSSDLSAMLINRGGDATPPFAMDRFVLPRTHEPIGQLWNQGDVGGAVGDLDNDGLLDIVITSTAYNDTQYLNLYRQIRPGQFTVWQERWGPELRDCNQVALADVNGDGWLDLICAANRTRFNKRPADMVVSFLNQPRAEHHWVTLTLEGSAGRDGVTPERRSNRSAIGARVWITAGGRTAMREVTTSTGHFGLQVPRTLHVGLGTATTVERVRIRWPDRAGTVESHELLPANRHYLLRQGDPKPRTRAR